jgi:hypothetical protein
MNKKNQRTASSRHPLLLSTEALQRILITSCALAMSASFSASPSSDRIHPEKQVGAALSVFIRGNASMAEMQTKAIKEDT